MFWGREWAPLDYWKIGQLGAWPLQGFAMIACWKTHEKHLSSWWLDGLDGPMCTRIAQFTLWNPLGFRLPICTLIIDLGLALRIGSNRLIPYLAQKSDPLAREPLPRGYMRFSAKYEMNLLSLLGCRFTVSANVQIHTSSVSNQKPAVHHANLPVVQSWHWTIGCNYMWNNAKNRENDMDDT